MAARSLNKAMLIGNLTRDPELRYTPQGTAVCSFGLATNRYWTTDTGEKREETEFHRIVAWNKLAELCSQLLTKGRKVFVEGRLQTRNWQAQDGTQRVTTEIVIEDMIILDSRRMPGEEAAAPVGAQPAQAPATVAEEVATEVPGGEPVAVSPAVTPSDDTSSSASGKKKRPTQVKEVTEDTNKTEEEINPDDIPF